MRQHPCKNAIEIANINKDKRINLQGGNQIVEILSENGQKYYLDKTVLSKDEFVINYILDLLPPVIYIDDFKDWMSNIYE